MKSIPSKFTVCGNESCNNPTEFVITHVGPAPDGDINKATVTSLTFCKEHRGVALMTLISPESMGMTKTEDMSETDYEEAKDTLDPKSDLASKMEAIKRIKNLFLDEKGRLKRGDS